MREIKFRGLRTDDKGWAYGGYVAGQSGNHYIFQGNDIEFEDDDCLKVTRKSLGQFTGLTDKNGKEIYEGDVIKLDYGNYKKMKIEFNDGAFLGVTFGIFPIGFPLCLGDKDFKKNGIEKDFFKSIEIIGNIHENPKLLK